MYQNVVNIFASYKWPVKWEVIHSHLITLLRQGRAEMAMDNFHNLIS